MKRPPLIVTLWTMVGATWLGIAALLYLSWEMV